MGKKCTFYKRICKLQPYFVWTPVLSSKMIARHLHGCTGQVGMQGSKGQILNLLTANASHWVRLTK